MQILLAGLPDIVGALTAPAMGNAAYSETNAPFFTKSGVFNSSEIIDGLGADYRGGGTFQVNFKASDSNTIYGKSESVQPNALQLIPQIRF